MALVEEDREHTVVVSIAIGYWAYIIIDSFFLG